MSVKYHSVVIAWKIFFMANLVITYCLEKYKSIYFNIKYRTDTVGLLTYYFILLMVNAIFQICYLLLLQFPDLKWCKLGQKKKGLHNLKRSFCPEHHR